MGAAQWLTVSSVVVCKRELMSRLPSEDYAYLYTLRYLLERLSWLARDSGHDLHFVLASITRFKLAKLREYESRLQGSPGCQIAWRHVAPGRIDQPSRVEGLQLADFCASATFKAFEPDQYGNTEERYLRELAPRLYRRGAAPLTSYGLKMHPWNNATRAAHPWVAALEARRPALPPLGWVLPLPPADDRPCKPDRTRA